MIHITQGGVIIDDGAIEKARLEYEQTGLAMLPRFLTPPLLNALLAKVDVGEFRHKTEQYIKGATLLMPLSDPALVTLHFMVNRPELFDAVSRITGVPKPGNFTSRLHRTMPAEDLHLDWHDDGLDYRTLGLNINLSSVPYEGGILEMRSPDHTVVGSVGQLPAGDAFLFRIGNGWQHRLTPVRSGHRTVAVGWFRTRPDWNDVALAGIRGSAIDLAVWGE